MKRYRVFWNSGMDDAEQDDTFINAANIDALVKVIGAECWTGTQDREKDENVHYYICFENADDAVKFFDFDEDTEKYVRKYWDSCWIAAEELADE